MSFNLKCTIPCIPYLAKYLYWKERIEIGTPVNLNYASGDISYVLSGLLTTKIKADHFDDDELPDNYSMDVMFRISPRKFNYGQIIISEDAVRMFNSFLRKNMHELLMDRILRAREMNLKLKEKDIIYGFMTELGIEDDISFDALKKYQQRLRKDREIGPFHQQNRPEAA